MDECEKKPRIITESSLFWGNAQLQAYAVGGFTPATVAPPGNKTRTGTTSSSRSSSRGGKGERHGPSFICPWFVFQSRVQGISRTGFFKNVRQYFFMTADPD